MIHYYLNKVEKYQPIISVEKIFTDYELDKINDQLSKVNVEAALAGFTGDINNPDDYNKGVTDTHSIRKSNVYWLDNSDHDWIYDKVSIAINHVNITNYHKILYGIQYLQYTEYDSEYLGFYGKHIDSDDSHPCFVRTLSFTLQLSKSEDYEGGDVLIYHDNKISKSNRTYGAITFFDSKIIHEVTPVTSGFRKSLVGWIIGPKI